MLAAMLNDEQNSLQGHSHLPAAPAMPYSLPDLLRSTPQVLDLLGHDVWSALSACSRQLRQLVQHVTKAVHLPRMNDVGLLFKYTRAQLSVIFVWDVTDTESTIENILTKAGLQLSDVDTRVHTYIMLSNEMHHQFYTHHAMLLMLHTPQGQQHHLACQAEQTLAGMSKWAQYLRWTYARVLVMPNKFGAMGVAALLAHLRHWSMLDLTMSILDRAGVEQLVSARLRFLEVLNISKNKLGADSVRLLAHSSWPYLQEIDLSNNQLDSQTLAHLFTAGWQLTVLCLRGLKLKADSMAVLAAHAPSSLRALDPQDNRLDVAAIYPLARGNWHDLVVLRLSDNNLNDDAMSHLSTGTWPTSATLRFSTTLSLLTAYSAYQLVLCCVWNTLQ